MTMHVGQQKECDSIFKLWRNSGLLRNNAKHDVIEPYQDVMAFAQISKKLKMTLKAD